MKNIVFILFSFLLLGACKSPMYLSSPNDFKHHVKGLILKVDLDEDTQVLGEIIEVNNEAITILTLNQDKATIITVLKKDIHSADIVISSTSDNPKGLGTWAGLINLTTLYHGYFMVLSVPINLGTTIFISRDAAIGTYSMKYPENVSWEQISKFARFPQGIPEHIDIKQIK